MFRFFGPVTLWLLAAVALAAWSTPAVAQTWMQQAPEGTPPSPRYVSSAAYDDANDRLILFSGEVPGPSPNDVWVLVNASGARGPAAWIQLYPTGGPPPGRELASLVYAPASNRLIVHGGCGGNCDPVLNDVWVLTNANGTGGTPAWIQLPPAPTYARIAHGAAYDPVNNRMIVFGGSNGYTINTNDVYVLTNADGTGNTTPGWEKLYPAGAAPAARSCSSAVYDPAANRLLVFAGAQVESYTATNFNDVWILTNANGLGGTPAWIEVAPAGILPSPRTTHSAVYDSAAKQMIVFGGYYDGRPSQWHADWPTFNDVWVLSNATGLTGAPRWRQLDAGGAAPVVRGYHTAAYAPASNRMMITMGRNFNLGLFNDVWVLTDASTLSVEIDIKPGSLPNTINTGSGGTVPVAIFGSAVLDARTINPLTVTLAGAGVQLRGQGVPMASYQDVNGDGRHDLVVHVITAALNLSPADTLAVLTGRTFSGAWIRGADAIRVVR
jgi:hypothetical protein